MLTNRSLSPVLAASLLALTLAGTANGDTGDESFHYRWRLKSFLGRLAGLFFPNQGDGVLSFQTTPEGHLISTLDVTSEKSDEGEFWSYGAEVDILHQRTLRAWSSYRFRGKGKEKEDDVEEEGVVDIAYGIFRIRADPPRSPQRLRIWSDGHIYPVDVLPQGTETRKVGGEKIETRHYLIQGAEEPNQRFWKGTLELWLAQDPESTPVAILIRRTGIGVLLELVEPS
jgi:hypothetical protein